ncbi:transposase-like protein, IS1239 [Streptococcus pneumoniae]|nr:transposase-like protein, IS1239 [Streptococcus pneumoniae]
MQDNYTTKGKHLTIDSRRLIERWKKEGKSNREIASLLSVGIFYSGLYLLENIISFSKLYYYIMFLRTCKVFFDKK